MRLLSTALGGALLLAASAASATFSITYEPGTWAMLIAGFGLTGLAARRRRLARVVAA